MIAWKRTTRMLKAPNLVRWYKKYIHRKNRRNAKALVNKGKEPIDKRLDPWAID
jgi:hypothetical protein